MRKEIKKWGNSLVVVFSPEERRIAGIFVGDIIDFNIMNIETKEPLE